MSENNEPIFSVLNGKAACQVGSGYCACDSGYYAVGYTDYSGDGYNETRCCPDGYDYPDANGNCVTGLLGDGTPGPNYSSESPSQKYCFLSSGACF